MPVRNLTPETEVQLHLAKARDYWRADRLDRALAAMRLALRVGLYPGDTYDLQRTIEAEYGARAAGRIYRVEESLSLEADPAVWGGHWPAVIALARQAVESVADALGVRWGKPVLLTLFPREEWAEFMHARYGYYAARAESHKICLPPSAVYPPGQFRRAALHEAAHAATHTLAGEQAPRWLDEGVAVMLEGGSPDDERRRYRIAVNRGTRLRLEELSAGLESYGTEIGSARSLLCYAGAGDFVRRLTEAYGLDRLREFLCLLGEGRRLDRAFATVYAMPLRRAEAEWHRHLSQG